MDAKNHLRADQTQHLYSGFNKKTANKALFVTVTLNIQILRELVDVTKWGPFTEYYGTE